METEVYSKRMAVHVRRDLRQANGIRFAELLAYYKVRGGPGLALAEKELAERQARQTHNRKYNKSHHSLQSCSLPLSTPTPTAPAAAKC
jgi:hypothetical protein